MSTKWNESTNPLEKKPLSDLQKRGLEAAEQRKSDRLERSIKRLKKEPDYPAKVISYDVNLGVYNVQKGSDVYQARSITNGAIAPGDNVALKPGTGSTALIDQMWVPKKKKVAEDAIVPTKPNIKYVYVTGGSSPSRTALCVAGYKQGWTVRIDEWNNSEFELRSATIDNLGGANFIVSYVLRKRVTLPGVFIQVYEHTFKVSRNGGNIFSYTLDPKYLDTILYPSAALSQGLGFTSVGYGNWVSNNLTDITIAQINSSSTSTGLAGYISGDTIFRLSGISTGDEQIVDLQPYRRNYTGISGGITVTPAYGYLNPELKANTYLNDIQALFYVTPTNAFGYTQNLSIFNIACIRWNRNGKSLTYYDRAEVFFVPYVEPGTFTYVNLERYSSGFRTVGYSIVTSRGAQPVEIPFRQFYPQEQSTSVQSDYQCSVNVVQGSDIATITSGSIPTPGTVLTGGVFRYGVTVLETNGSIIKLSEPSTETTDLPDNPTSISWGFPLGSGGGLLPIDLLTTGVSYFQLSRLTRPKTGSIPQILSEPIEFPVVLFGDNLRPSGKEDVKVYSPAIINTGTGISNNFRVLHASYSPT